MKQYTSSEVETTMNTYFTLACLLAVVGLSLGNPYGYGILAPAAISHANVVKAAPIPVIRAVAPIYTAPILRTVAAPIAVGYGGLGHGGLGYGGLGYGGLGYGGLGYGGLGGWGGGYGLGGGWGRGYGGGWGRGYGYGGLHG